MDQFVYIVTNPSIPNQIKVGRTTDPKRRLKELQSSGVPTPYRYELLILVEDSKHSEAAAHYALRFNRVAANREFFRIEVDEAIRKITDEIKFFKIDWRYTPQSEITRSISGNLERFASAQIKIIEEALEKNRLEILSLTSRTKDVEECIRELRSKMGSGIGLVERLRLQIFGDEANLLQLDKSNQVSLSKLNTEREALQSSIKYCKLDRSDLIDKLKWRQAFFREELERLRTGDQKVLGSHSKNAMSELTHDYSMERFSWYRDIEGVKCDVLHECYPNGEFIDHGNEISIQYRGRTFFISTEKIVDFEIHKVQKLLF